TRDWLIDRLNECNVVELEHGPFKDALDLLCPSPHDELKACYDDVNKQLMERVKLAGTGQLGPDESAAFEAARVI
ncbi:hypothetical protein NPIL_446761, partial [Nephila pilipes]